ncbi:MAG: hypothetical protein AAGA58_06820 [Verrucomicrobiota bacterium]
MEKGKEYLGFGGKLNHEIPHWVDMRESLFHIRIRSVCADLTKGENAEELLESALFYSANQRWFCELMLVMPDHLHALIHFGVSSRTGMSQIIGDWKRYQTKSLDVEWQENYFDHRLRSHEQGSETFDYIRRNPVVKGLCGAMDEWKWWLQVNPTSGEITRGWR